MVLANQEIVTTISMASPRLVTTDKQPAGQALLPVASQLAPKTASFMVALATPMELLHFLVARRITPQVPVPVPVQFL
jgi:hypothetical protein